MSPTTQAGGRTRDLRDGGSTCHGSHQQEKGTPLCLQPPPSLALALFCAAQFLPVVVISRSLVPFAPFAFSASATRVPPSPSAPAPPCHPCLQGRCLESRRHSRSQFCWAQWREHSLRGLHRNEDSYNSNNNNNNADRALHSMVMPGDRDFPAQCGSRLVPGDRSTIPLMLHQFPWCFLPSFLPSLLPLVKPDNLDLPAQ